MSELDKKELKQLFEELRKNQNEETIRKIYDKYRRIVYAIAYSICKNKEDSEDVVQNVFIKIFKLDKDKLPKDKAATWLYTVTKNETLSIIKNKNKDVDIEKIYEIADGNDEIQNVINKENFNKLISNLNDKEREIISLKIISNLSFKEISKLLDEPIGTVKWRYYKSIHEIKRLLLLFSNFMMFIITFALGNQAMHNQKSIKPESEIEDEFISTDDVKPEDTSNTPQMPDEEYRAEPSQTEKVENLITKPESDITDGKESIVEDKDELYDKEENIVEENIIQEEIIEEDTVKEETILVQNETIGDHNYFSIGLLGCSLVFFIITILIIIFLKKDQLKLRKKSSK